MGLTALGSRLIDGWQQNFPLVPQPYNALARELGASEAEVIGTLDHLKSAGVLSRVGATLRPNTAGASTLAALQVPSDRLDQVAAIVNAEPGVNHNYEREHDLNLWFVVTGRDRDAVALSLSRIEAATGLECLDLPLERAYFINLGFALGDHDRRPRQSRSTEALPARRIDDLDRAILAALESGLPHEPLPFRAIAERQGVGEDEVLARLAAMIEAGIITRFGLIVRHRMLGYVANAMAVWDVPDGDVDRVGEAMAEAPFVTLCYRRPRRLPRWPYNLFCMVHGKERRVVTDQVASLTTRVGVESLPHTILFSRRCFKQRGPSVSVR